ncbi:MAG: EVE domain-containing protein [Azospirillaceae bacterium]|nr:EVE domain-containing protein [Azospirillaceae bacterium]
MAYWLVKSEPVKYSWDHMVEDGVTFWNGVRNHQASNNLKAMRLGDRAFFYHSNEGLAIVGIVEIVREYYPDPSDDTARFGMVDVRALEAMPAPVTLKMIKSHPALSEMALVRQSRLSVSPVNEHQWLEICRLGGLTTAAEPGPG